MRKKTFRKRLITSALLCVVLMVAGGYVYVSNPVCSGTECLIKQKIQGYKKTEVYQYTDRLFGALFKKDHFQLRADIWLNIEQQEADNIIKNHTIRMYTLYEMAVSPYPGEVSSAISCAPEYRPTYAKEQINAKEVHIFTGFANDRLVFGACADDLITKRAAVVMFYCGQEKRLYKFELFAPVGEPTEVFNKEVAHIRAISCE